MNKENIIKLSPTWHTYHRKVNALFGKDPDIIIKDLAKIDDGSYTYMMLISNKEKAAAIKAILPSTVTFGSINVNACILGPEEDEIIPITGSEVDIYKSAFSGNPIVTQILEIKASGISFAYCIFKKEIVQFWNDDLSDYRGNFNGLPSDIARELLISERIQFCISAE